MNKYSPLSNSAQHIRGFLVRPCMDNKVIIVMFPGYKKLDDMCWNSTPMRHSEQ